MGVNHRNTQERMNGYSHICAGVSNLGGIMFSAAIGLMKYDVNTFQLGKNVV